MSGMRGRDDGARVAEVLVHVLQAVRRLGDVDGCRYRLDDRFR